MPSDDLAAEWRQNFKSVLVDYAIAVGGDTSHIAASLPLSEAIQAMEDLVQDRMSAEREAVLGEIAVTRTRTFSRDERFEAVKNRWQFGPGVSTSLVSKFDYDDVQWLIGEVERLDDELALNLELKHQPSFSSAAAFAEKYLGKSLPPDDPDRYGIKTVDGDVIVYDRGTGAVIVATKQAED